VTVSYPDWWTAQPGPDGLGVIIQGPGDKVDRTSVVVIVDRCPEGPARDPLMRQGWSDFAGQLMPGSASTSTVSIMHYSTNALMGTRHAHGGGAIDKVKFAQAPCAAGVVTVIVVERNRSDTASVALILDNVQPTAR